MIYRLKGMSEDYSYHLELTWVAVKLLMSFSLSRTIISILKTKNNLLFLLRTPYEILSQE